MLTIPASTIYPDLTPKPDKEGRADALKLSPDWQDTDQLV